MDSGKRTAIPPIRLATEAPFTLGAAQVTPATRLFQCGDRSAPLEPRVMQVLVALYRAGGAVVSRETLLAQCWDGRTVGDNAIHRVIGKLRGLAAACGAGFEIETIAKVGYQLKVSGAAPRARDEGAGARLAASSRRRFAIAGAAILAAGAGAALLLRRPDGADARVADLLAQAEHAKSLGLPSSEQQGIGFLQEAAALRPRDAEIWGRLALACSVAAEYAPPAELASIVARTQTAARRALALDAAQADALAALALLPSYYGDWFAAEKRMSEVLSLHPDHVPTRDARDFFHVAVGRCREGCSSRLRYAADAPLDAHLQYRLVYALWILGRIGEADRSAERGLQLWPRHPGVWFSHLWTLAFTGRAQRALAGVEDEAARPPLPPFMLDALTLSLQAMVSRVRADVARASDALFAALQQGPSHAVNALMLLNGLGEVDAAFAVAEAYFLERGPVLATLRWGRDGAPLNDQRRRKTNMLFVPATAPMRADRRFQTLTAEIGLAAYWRQARIVPDHLIG